MSFEKLSSVISERVYLYSKICENSEELSTVFQELHSHFEEASWNGLTQISVGMIGLLTHIMKVHEEKLSIQIAAKNLMSEVSDLLEPFSSDTHDLQDFLPILSLLLEAFESRIPNSKEGFRTTPPCSSPSTPLFSMVSFSPRRKTSRSRGVPRKNSNETGIDSPSIGSPSVDSPSPTGSEEGPSDAKWKTVKRAEILSSTRETMLSPVRPGFSSPRDVRKSLDPGSLSPELAKSSETNTPLSNSERRLGKSASPDLGGSEILLNRHHHDPMIDSPPRQREDSVVSIKMNESSPTLPSKSYSVATLGRRNSASRLTNRSPLRSRKGKGEGGKENEKEKEKKKEKKKDKKKDKEGGEEGGVEKVKEGQKEEIFGFFKGSGTKKVKDKNRSVINSPEPQFQQGNSPLGKEGGGGGGGGGIAFPYRNQTFASLSTAKDEEGAPSSIIRDRSLLNFSPPMTNHPNSPVMIASVTLSDATTVSAARGVVCPEPIMRCDGGSISPELSKNSITRSPKTSRRSPKFAPREDPRGYFQVSHSSDDLNQKKKKSRFRNKSSKKGDEGRERRPTILPPHLALASPPQSAIDLTSLPDVIATMTENTPDVVEIRKAFFLTYTRFATAFEVVRLLRRRWSGDPMKKTLPPNYWRKSEIVETLKCWIDTNISDLIFDKTVEQEIPSFFQEIDSDELISPNLIGYFKQKKEEFYDAAMYFKPSRNPADLSWDVFDPAEIAKSITFEEFDLFSEIPSVELLTWNRRTSSNCPKISAMISNSTRISTWVTSELMKRMRADDRVKLLEKFLKLCEHLFELNNLSSYMAMFGGLTNSAFWRMKKTWARISSDSQKIYDHMAEILSHSASYAVYRNHLKTIKPPCIPYIGAHLSDLTFLDDGNKDKQLGCINFKKWIMVAKVIQETLSFQSVSYSDSHPPPQFQFSSALKSIDILTEDKCHQYSRYAEPRDSETAIEELLNSFFDCQKQLTEAKSNLLALQQVEH